MFLSLALVTLILAGSLGLLLVNLRHAPEGHEDDQGFHFKDPKASVAYAHYDAFAGQLPKRYPAKVAGGRLAA